MRMGTPHWLGTSIPIDVLIVSALLTFLLVNEITRSAMQQITSTSILVSGRWAVIFVNSTCPQILIQGGGFLLEGQKDSNGSY